MNRLIVSLLAFVVSSVANAELTLRAHQVSENYTSEFHDVYRLTNISLKENAEFLAYEIGYRHDFAPADEYSDDYWAVDASYQGSASMDPGGTYHELTFAPIWVTPDGSLIKSEFKYRFLELDNSDYTQTAYLVNFAVERGHEIYENLFFMYELSLYAGNYDVEGSVLGVATEANAGVFGFGASTWLRYKWIKSLAIEFGVGYNGYSSAVGETGSASILAEPGDISVSGDSLNFFMGAKYTYKGVN